MRVLVTGADGQLGWELGNRGKEHGLDIVSVDLPDFDITRSSDIQKTVEQTGASLVINAAAYTAVDQAEKEIDLAYKVNRDGPAYLASVCAAAGIPLIHISTDYVFDGDKESPYLETDPVSPLGAYGRTKAAGEAEVRAGLYEHIILRTAWLYGVHGNNFVKTMLRLGREKESLSVVADQYGCPTYAADFAEAILTISEKHRDNHKLIWGTYHYCGNGMTTWYDFAKQIFKLAKGFDSTGLKEVVPVKTKEYPTPAKRPANSVLDCSLFIKNFGVRPRPWKDSLADMIESYYQKKEFTCNS